MPPPPDMAFWLGQKYSILGKTAEGEYQRNVAEAGKVRAETGEVAPNAASMRALQAAQSGLYGQEATDLSANRYLPEDAWRQIYRRGLGVGPQDQGGQQPVDQGPQARPGTAPVTIQRGLGGPSQTYQVPHYTDPLLDTNPGKPLPNMRPLGSLADPNTQGSQRGGGVLDPNQPVLPLKPRSELDLPGITQFAQMGNSDVVPLRKGSANVKAPKGGKSGGKSGGKGGGGGAPQGLEQILPALMAASQASQMGGGAVGPQAADSNEPPMAPGAAAPATQPPGMRRGMTNVMGYQEGTQDVAPGGGGNPIHIHILSGFGSNQPTTSEPPTAVAAKKGTADVKAPAKKENGKAKSKAPAKAPGPGLPRGLGAILPQLLAAAQQGGGPPGVPPIAPGGPAPPQPPGPPGMAMGAASVMDPRSAHSAPGYPFGAGYLFGATAVPGQGSGTVDKVPAMLAPHEAVLNRAAADMMGRGKIAALNAAGAQQMGLRRGAR